MDDETTRRATTMARKVAYKVARRCWWADHEELVQAALLQVVKGYANFDPAIQCFDAWCGEVCRRAVYRSLIRASAITSGHQHSPSSVRGVLRESVEMLESFHASHETPDAAYAHARNVANIRTGLLEALGNEGSVEFALAVLGGEWSAAELAEANGLPVEDVYATTSKVRRRIERSGVLYRLWRGSNEE